MNTASVNLTEHVQFKRQHCATIALLYMQMIYLRFYRNGEMFSEFRILILTVIFPASGTVYGAHAEGTKKLFTLRILKCS
jgi:hypothetical protein